MKNLAQITTIVQTYLGDPTAVVTQPILDSVNFLSNLFSIDSIDTSQSTAVNGTTLNIPTNGLEINAVFINGEEIRKLKNLDDLETVRLTEQQRWYEFGGVIQFTQPFTAVVTTRIHYKKGFKTPETAVATDVPLHLLELVYLGAQVRYFNLLLTQVATAKENLPDIKPDELRKIKKDLETNLNDKIKMIKINANSI